jgi:hypothetical protein
MMRKIILKLYGSSEGEIRESLRDSKTNRQILWGAGWGVWVPATVVIFVAWLSGVKVPFPVVALLVSGACLMPPALIWWTRFDRELKASLPPLDTNTGREEQQPNHGQEERGPRIANRHEIARDARALGRGRRPRR